jgi:deoxycytidylate deaminase
MNFDWNELAFGSKKPLNELKPIFIMAPHDMTTARFNQLVKTYLPTGNVVVGLAKDSYILGFEGQPQFKALEISKIKNTLQKVNNAGTKNKIYTLSYFQRDSKHILEKLDFKKVVLINGSWKYAFHTRREYYILVNRHIAYDMVSPFADTTEAINYERAVLPPEVTPKGIFTESQMLQMAAKIAERSFDYNFQTGVTLGKKKGKAYTFIAQAFNKVVPYQGYAMHCGATRETHFSPPHDLNHYDTIHAEVALVVRAQKENIDLKNTTLFINLLPCPTCARMFVETDIAEFVYREDHSDGYAVKMLELAGKKVTRIVE